MDREMLPTSLYGRWPYLSHCASIIRCNLVRALEMAFELPDENLERHCAIEPNGKQAPISEVSASPSYPSTTIHSRKIDMYHGASALMGN